MVTAVPLIDVIIMYEFYAFLQELKRELLLNICIFTLHYYFIPDSHFKSLSRPENHYR